MVAPPWLGFRGGWHCSPTQLPRPDTCCLPTCYLDDCSCAPTNSLTGMNGLCITGLLIHLTRCLPHPSPHPLLPSPSTDPFTGPIGFCTTGPQIPVTRFLMPGTPCAANIQTICRSPPPSPPPPSPSPPLPPVTPCDLTITTSRSLGNYLTPIIADAFLQVRLDSDVMQHAREQVRLGR